MPLLKIRNLTVEAFFPEEGWRPVITGFNLSVGRGEVVALIGESGGGKTTIGLCALGYARPGMRIASGEVLFEGDDILRYSTDQLQQFRGGKVAYVAQSAAAALNPALKVGRQIEEGLRQHRVSSRAEAGRRAVDLLRRLNLPDPENLVNRYPHELSGGQQQRVMTAMAMACDPALIVFDEPTTALDVTTQVQVLKSIKDTIRTADASALYVSHDLAVVSQVATRIVVLRNGAIVEQGPTFDVLHRPAEDYTRLLLDAVRTVPEAPIGETSVPGPCVPEAAEPALVSVRGIEATYQKTGFLAKRRALTNVLHGVDIEIRRSEILAIVGESGSGKSTLARIIAGLHAPTKGSVAYAGETLPARVSGRSLDMLRRIQIVFQSPEQALNPRLSVGQAVGRPLAFYFRMGGREKMLRVRELLDMVGLPARVEEKSPRELSGGQRQRVAIARALAARPDIILCDEFLSALDTVVAARITELMERLRDQLGTAFVFISHDLATVAEIADRVIVLKDGRVVDAGSTTRIFNEDVDRYTDLLIRSVPQLRPGWLEETLAAGPAKA
ncbi:ABC transporter ATP-binding protein [Ensifer soli]|uniref:ABC transporter ATP-binding protein n=1 Tax=Ciceribacter sp. sgz301302 TaxID=3342379 RepID=UPI0035BBABF0